MILLDASKTDTINATRTLLPKVAVDFDWTPKLGPFSYSAGGTIYEPAGAFTTQSRRPITFTATVSIPPQLPDHRSIIEYRWDLGDGTIGYGNPITHTFKFANLQAACILRVTDSRGEYWYSRHQLYLTAVDEVVLVKAIMVDP